MVAQNAEQVRTKDYVTAEGPACEAAQEVLDYCKKAAVKDAWQL